MRVLVCGGRNYANYKAVFDALDAIPGIEAVIEGGARGADYIAKMWATKSCVSCQTFEADWERYGTSAGPIRNALMLEDGKPDLVLAFSGGKGTASMVKLARYAGVEVREIE